MGEKNCLSEMWPHACDKGKTKYDSPTGLVPMTSQIPVRMGSTQTFSPLHARGNIVLYHLFTELQVCHTKLNLYDYTYSLTSTAMIIHAILNNVSKLRSIKLEYSVEMTDRNLCIFDNESFGTGGVRWKAFYIISTFLTVKAEGLWTQT